VFLLELEPPSDVEEFEEVGVRRSARCRFAPVAYWRGERLEYAPWEPGTNRQCPEIRGVRRIREEPFWKSRRAPIKKRPRGRGRSFTAEYDGDGKPPEHEWDKDTLRDGVVVDHLTEEEFRRREWPNPLQRSPLTFHQGSFVPSTCSNLDTLQMAILPSRRS